MIPDHPEHRTNQIISIAGILTAAAVMLGVFVLFGIGLRALQPLLVFQPGQNMEQTPTDWGLAFEDVSIQSSQTEGPIHGWLIQASAQQPKQQSGARPVLLFLHGNAGNISHRGESVRIFAALGLDVLIIDYRGYGRSPGKPSEQGLYDDALAAWNWLTEQRHIPAENIFIFGRSLGGAVATELAARVHPAGLIVEASFDHMRHLALRHSPVLTRLFPLPLHFPSARHIASVTCPVMILHSPDDELVPIAFGRALFDAAPAPKRFVQLRGGHNDAFLRSQPDYQRSLGEFIAQPNRAGTPAN